MRNEIAGVFWDVGGTLVEFAMTLVEFVRGALASAGVDASGISDGQIHDAFERFYAGERSWTTVDESWQATRGWSADLLAPCGGASPAEQAAVAAALWQYAGMYRPVGGIVDLIHDLRAAGLKQVVVSNWPPTLPLFLAHHGLDALFDAVVYSGQDGIHKPDPLIFHRALTAAGLTPESVLFIGDNPEWDVIPPRALGMRAIHFDPRRKHATCDAATVPELQALLRGLARGA